MYMNLEQKFGIAEGVTVSQCLIHNSGESVIPPPALCLCPPTYFMVVRSITSTHINSLVFKLRTK